MTRILLSCEEVWDQGRNDYSDTNVILEEGVVQILIKKVSEQEDLTFSIAKRNDLRKITLLRRSIGKKAKGTRLAFLAQKRDCSYIAYHQDEDNRGFQEIYRQVRENLKIAAEKGKVCLAIIPMHTMESWLLSDEKGFPSIPKSPCLPKKPEEIWGTRESDTHPKRYLKRVLNQYHQDPFVESYTKIANQSDMDVLRKRCRISFGCFCEDIKSFLNKS